MENNTKKSFDDQSGQTLVEFVLLMAAIVLISFSFIKSLNGFISDRWETLANVILDDKNQSIKL